MGIDLADLKVKKEPDPDMDKAFKYMDKAFVQEIEMH